jgi:hypothetical protein
MAGRSDIMAGKAFVELSLKNSLTGGIKAAGQQLRNFGSTISMVGGVITAAGAGMKAFFGAALAKFAESGDKIDKMSRRTGIGANALSELGFAAEQSGKDLDTLEGSLKKMQKSVGNALGNATAGGSEKANAALAQARADLDAATAKAAAAAHQKELDDLVEENKKKGKNAVGDQGDIHGTTKQTSFATFSIAAARAQVGAMDPVVKAIEKQEKGADRRTDKICTTIEKSLVLRA